MQVTKISSFTLFLSSGIGPVLYYLLLTYEDLGDLIIIGECPLLFF